MWPVAIDVAHSVVYVSVCQTHGWAMERRLNHWWAILACRLEWAQGKRTFEGARESALLAQWICPVFAPAVITNNTTNTVQKRCHEEVMWPIAKLLWPLVVFSYSM